MIMLGLTSVSYANESTDEGIFFYPNKHNYIIAGRDKNGIENIKFQIGLRINLVDNTCFNFAFNQKSFWDIGRESAPFREHNYNPELFCQLEKVKFGYEHESNGRDGVESRSWERISVTTIQKANDYLTFVFKVWSPFFYAKENKDIIHYYGYGELTGSLAYSEHFEIRMNARKRSLLTDLMIGRYVSNIMIHIQHFQGIGESLIDYNKYDKNTRIGVTFSNGF